MSGQFSDNRDLMKASKEGDERSKLAIDVQIKRICDYVGSYYVLMGGLDALVFTAGIGENSADMRKLIVDRLAVLGVRISKKRNQERGTVDITCHKSKVKVFVIKTNEEVMIAREVLKV